MNPDINYIITIKENFAKDWFYKNYNKRFIGQVITRPEQAYGINFTNENTLIMIGERFDYPEHNPQLTIREKEKFDKLLYIVNQQLKRNFSIGQIEAKIIKIPPYRLQYIDKLIHTQKPFAYRIANSIRSADSQSDMIIENSLVDAIIQLEESVLDYRTKLAQYKQRFGELK